MYITYSDDKRLTENALKTKTNKLFTYRKKIEEYRSTNNSSVSEYSLYYAQDYDLQETLSSIKKNYKGVKHLVLLGIGGSSLGLEAIHSVLNDKRVTLSILDTVSANSLNDVLTEVKKLKKVSQIAICIISKSGNTTETLANASILLAELELHFSTDIYKQTFFIGDNNTDLVKYAKKVSATYISIPNVIGGRYSVATAVGLVPMAILGYDTDEFISGYMDASQEQYETITADSAARISLYYQNKYQHYNFFAFETRLEKLGRWYRQLFAESLGKEFDLDNKLVSNTIIPTISTPIELHSIGQLYLSGRANVYTDFVTFDDETIDFKIPNKTKLATSIKGLSMQEIATALYGGVIGAYKERQLPFRATIFEESLTYSLGLFMAMRLREVMYTANLLNLNAFDQPNVELYKIKTKEILNI